MNASVVEWLEKTSNDMPDSLALVDQGNSITWKEYHDKAVGIAEVILRITEGQRKPVLVYLEKSVRVPISFMGVAYSGCYYSVLDVDMPLERAKRIIETFAPSVIITSSDLIDKMASFEYDGSVVDFDSIESIPYSKSVVIAYQKTIDTDLLYVLFTSGSTGIPKGVCITHRGVIDYTDFITSEFKVDRYDRFGNQAPFYFDNSILDIYCTMKSGACLFIIPRSLFIQPVKLLEYLRDNKINTIFWVPSALIVVSSIKALSKIDLSGSIKRVLFCGEVMPNKQLNIWRKALPNTLFANLYGPTEITDACTFFIVDRDFNDDESLPIGFPMRNTEILVMDENNKLINQPFVPGELCVRGTGVSCGYYNNPGKTAEAFVQNPFNTAYEEKIYKTGDLVQYNERGELLYLSRKDFQIKHMGHRIELGEIETAVSAIEGISQCCCLYDTHNSRIVLFIDKDLTKEAVLSIIKEKVPHYMLPGKVIYMEKLPQNLNGKIDRVLLKEYLK